MNSGPIDTLTPVEHALAAVEGAVGELITALRDGGLDHHDQPCLLGLLDRAEIVRNQWQAIDAELLAACSDRGVAERECQRSMAKVLERRFLNGPGEAARRVQAATAVGPRTTSTGMPLPRLRDAVGAAMCAGQVTWQQVVLVDKTLGRLELAQVRPEQIQRVEAELVEHCRRFGPKELNQLCQRYLDAYDPDGPEPDERRNWDRRFFRMRSMRSGAAVGEFRLTPEVGVKLRAILSSLSGPRADTAGGLAGADLRSHDQRLHDAVGDMCARLLRAGGLPDSGGTPATVIVTIDQADLLADLKRAGTTKTGKAERGKAKAAEQGDEGTQPNEPDTAEEDADAAVRGEAAPSDVDTSRSGLAEGGRQAEGDAASQNLDGECIQGKGEVGTRVCENSPIHGQRGAGVAGWDATSADGQIQADAASQPRTEGTPTAQELDDLRSTIAADDPERPGRVRRSRPGRGISSDGTALSVRELLALAGEAEIYPVVLTSHGVLLEMGRERRIANKHQTLALIARDGGCSFPGCDHPPEWCERHHVIPWVEDGGTDLNNLTLLCSYHHHHFLDRGWQVRINPDGLPEWIPPRYFDPDQSPMINNRILARIHQSPLIT